MSVRVLVHVLALVLVAPIAAGPAEAGPPGSPTRALASSGAIATYSQILPPGGAPRVPPWQQYQGGVFSADGRSVVFPHTVIRQGPDTNTLRVQDEGENPRIVWEEPRWMQLPSWSPDGQRVAIATRNFGMESRNSDVWLIDPAGVDPPEEILTGRGGEFGVVAWSPDGDTIAYLRYGSDIFLYDVATRTSTQLTDFCTWADAVPPGPGGDCGASLTFGWGSIAWSPEGDQLLGTVNRKVVLIDAVTGDVTDIGASSAPFFYTAVWSPDGSEVAYTRASPRTFRPTTVVRAVGGGQERVVAEDQVTSWQPCPDGPCATFGTPRARSKVSASVARVRNTVKVRGEVGPSTDPQGSGRETVRITLQVKRAGSWRKVGVKEPRIDSDRLTFAASLKRPDGSRCRVQVSYQGGWTRGPSSDTVPFRC